MMNKALIALYPMVASSTTAPTPTSITTEAVSFLSETNSTQDPWKSSNSTFYPGYANTSDYPRMISNTTAYPTNGNSTVHPSGSTIENVFDDAATGTSGGTLRGRHVVVPTAPPQGLPGSRGVSNLGLTCYFGATLQVLSHSTRLRQYLDSNPSVNPNALETLFRGFIARMWDPENREAAIRPEEIFQALSALNSVEFRIGRMSDAHEALMSILDMVAESMKPAGSALHARSSLDPVLAIGTTQRSTCRGCARVSQRTELAFEAVLTIPELAVPVVPSQVDAAYGGSGFLDTDEALELLGIAPVSTGEVKRAKPVIASQPDAVSADFVTLNDCFAASAGEDIISGYDCEGCAPVRHEARQVRRITNTSGIITIALRRFTFEDEKIRTPVEIPMRLNMSEIACSETQGLYRLVGVVNHHGKTRHRGHYTAMVYNSAERRWMRMDDSHSEADMQFGTNGSFRSSEAYILLYERIDRDRAIRCFPRIGKTSEDPGMVSAAMTSSHFDVPIVRIGSGHYMVRAYRTVDAEYDLSDPIELILRFSRYLELDSRYRENAVSFIEDIEETNLNTGGPGTIFEAPGCMEYFGISPHRHFDNGPYLIIDVYRSGAEISFLRFWKSHDEFLSSACAPGTSFGVPVWMSSPHIFHGSFNFIDSVSGTYFQPPRTYFNAVQEIAIPNDIGAGPVVKIPIMVALEIEKILMANGARRTGILGGFRYEHCTSETMAHLPTLAVDLYDRDTLKGTIKLTPEQYIPDCRMSVQNGFSDYPSLDIFQIPNLNMRLAFGWISLCDSITA